LREKAESRKLKAELSVFRFQLSAFGCASIPQQASPSSASNLAR
jgi:hypothetical protein